MCKKTAPNFDIETLNEQQNKWVRNILLVHQTLMLVDVPFDILGADPFNSDYPQKIVKHLSDLQQALVEHDGLNYVPSKHLDGR